MQQTELEKLTKMSIHAMETILRDLKAHTADIDCYTKLCSVLAIPLLEILTGQGTIEEKDLGKVEEAFKALVENHLKLHKAGVFKYE